MADNESLCRASSSHICQEASTFVSFPFMRNVALNCASALLAGLCALSATPASCAEKSWCGPAGGDWGDPANWSPAGIPALEDDVIIASGSVSVTSASVTAASLSLASGASLTVYAGEVDYGGSYLSLPGDGATVEIAGNLSVASGAWIIPVAEPISGGTVRFNIGGNLSIAANGGFDASGKGWQYPCGPGFSGSTAWSDGHGGSYGGKGRLAWGSIPSDDRIYGYAFAPYLPGSPGRSNGTFATIEAGNGGNGGGSVRLHVTGDIFIAGSILADGHNNKDAVTATSNGTAGAGSGGSIFITCRNFYSESSAIISASGADTYYGGAGAGGGGRVAIITDSPSAAQIASLYSTGEASGLLVVTEDINNPAESPWPELVRVKGGICKSNASSSADSGTGVYLRNIGDRRSVNVSVTPSAYDLSLTGFDPIVGRSLVSGEVTAVAPEYSFVPATDSRQRRHCLGYAFSNDVGSVSSGTALSFSFDSSAATVSSFLEWDYSDLEYRLDVTQLGSGSVTGFSQWSDAGSTLLLTPIADEGWKFLCWDGEVPPADVASNPLSLTMSSPRAISAVFIPAEAPTEPLAALQSGEWFDPATWGGAVPSASTPVIIDGLAIVNTRPYHPEAASLELRGTASLTLGTENCTTNAGIRVAGDFALAGSSRFTVFAGETVVDPENVELFTGDGALVSISGNLSLADSSRIIPCCHTILGGSVRFNLGGNLTVASGAAFDASGKGYACPNGPGYFFYNGNGDGGSYGGTGGTGALEGGRTRTSGLPYGYRFAPFMAGSSGAKAYSTTLGGSGGGVIRIHATGDIQLDGSLIADGFTTGDARKYGDSGTGSGGGIWLSCRNFTPGETAKISAAGASGNNGTAGDTGGNWRGGGGGGRVAILIGSPDAGQIADLYSTGDCSNIRVLTTNVNDSAEYSMPSLIDVRGGYAYRQVCWGERGTAVILANIGNSKPLAVSVSPGIDSFEELLLDPAAGTAMAEGSFSATVSTPAFLSGTSRRERMHLVGYVYSNQTAVISSGDSPACTVKTSDGDELFLNWRFGRHEKLLRAEVFGDSSRGTVSALDNEGWYADGSSVTLSATPAAGWKFLCWAGDVAADKTSLNPLSVSMDRPRDLKAVFVPVESRTSLAAVRSGEWFDPATWGGEACPDASTDVEIGSSYAVYTEMPSRVACKSASLSTRASLRLWETVAAGDGAGTGYSGDLAFTVVSSLVAGDNSRISVGTANSSYNPSVTIGADLSLSGNALFEIYAGPRPSVDLVSYAAGGAKVAVASTISLADKSVMKPYNHEVNGAPVLFTANSIVISAQASFNTVAGGYAYCNGPGAYRGHVGKTGWIDEGHGASYGGVNSRFRESYPAQPTYGNPYAPFWAGSSGTTTRDAGLPGGGAIILEAANVVIEGALNADAAAASEGSGLGSGGSVWVRAKRITVNPLTAKVSAKGGSNTWGGAGASGGGRICFIEGALSDARLARLIALGDRDDFPHVAGFEVVCTNLASSAELSRAGLEAFAGVFSAEGGANSTYSPPWTSQSTPGTAVWLRTLGAGTLLFLR